MLHISEESIQANLQLAFGTGATALGSEMALRFNRLINREISRTILTSAMMLEYLDNNELRFLAQLTAGAP